MARPYCVSYPQSIPRFYGKNIYILLILSLAFPSLSVHWVYWVTLLFWQDDLLASVEYIPSAAVLLNFAGHTVVALRCFHSGHDVSLLLQQKFSEISFVPPLHVLSLFPGISFVPPLHVLSFFEPEIIFHQIFSGPDLRLQSPRAIKI
jgi:hypothetical protein